MLPGLYKQGRKEGRWLRQVLNSATVDRFWEGEDFYKGPVLRWFPRTKRNLSFLHSGLASILQSIYFSGVHGLECWRKYRNKSCLIKKGECKFLWLFSSGLFWLHWLCGVISIRCLRYRPSDAIVTVVVDGDNDDDVDVVDGVVEVIDRLLTLPRWRSMDFKKNQFLILHFTAAMFVFFL